MAEAMHNFEGALGELGELVRGLGCTWGPRSRERLGEWAELVIEWRTRARLTGLTTPGAVVRDLMMPAAFALPLIGRGGSQQVLDLGCGSGCTGVLLATVVRRGAWYLVDKSGKKVTFCRYALKRCGIEGVEALTRQEALDRGLRADVLLARALPRAAETRRDIGQLAGDGGVVVRWVSVRPSAEGVPAIKCGDGELWVVAEPVRCFT
jgi:16S rRNA (guanine527-N7)-methyltransferase